MSDVKPNEPLRIELTAEQREKLRRLTGREITEIALTAEELEQRIAPGINLQ
jgi:hypothetical protein